MLRPTQDWIPSSEGLHKQLMLRCPLDLDRDAAVLEQRTHFLFLPELETELQIVYLLGKTSRLQPSYTPGSPFFFHAHSFRSTWKDQSIACQSLWHVLIEIIVNCILVFHGFVSSDSVRLEPTDTSWMNQWLITPYVRFQCKACLREWG